MVSMLGHPSHQIITLLPNISSYVPRDNAPYDICFKSKQTRVLFSISSNKAKIYLNCFIVMCADLTGASYFLRIIDDFSRGV